MQKFLLFASLLIAVAGCSAKLSGQNKSTTRVKQQARFANVPDRRDVTLYQINIRAFSKEGNFRGIIPRLDSIRGLGANVIYLMPHYPVGKLKAVNSPYCIRDYTGVNPEFGTLSDLKALIDKAHEKGMAVILDWVANHTSFDHAWTSRPSWYLTDSSGKIMSPPGTGWNDVAQLNFKNADMRLAMIDAMKYWVRTANIDGFRCDYSDGPPVDFWKQAIDTLKNTFSGRFLMLSEGRRSEHYSIGFDYNFGFRFFENLKDIYSHNRSALSIDSLNESDYTGTSEGQLIIRYTSNHDVNGSDGTPEELFGGQQGAMAAFAIVAFMKSVPMIYNGQEVATPYRLVFPFTTKDIDWSINPSVTNEYRRILTLRNRSVAIRRGSLTSYTTPDVCAFSRESGSEKVFVMVNLRKHAVSFELPASIQDAQWKDAFTGSKVQLQTTIELKPYSYTVLMK